MTHLMFLVGVLLAGPTTAELSGTVVDQDGQPVAGAIVVISTAKPRFGPATTCPSCYRDCAKRSYTDAEGRFTFSELSSNLLFSLAAGGSGYQGTVSPYFDPALKTAVEIRLEPIPDSSGAAQASGVVVDQNGQPIAGAEIRSRGIYRADTITGPNGLVTPLTLTDESGQFRLAVDDATRSVDIAVTASGYAPAQVQWSRGDKELLKVQLGPGASLRGRLMFEDSPLAGIEMGIVQRDRTLGNPVTPTQVSTDEAGYFQFDHLPPDMEYNLYTHTGQEARGVLPVSLVEIPGHAMRADLGDIPTQAPHRLTITVRTEDGSLLPAESSVYIGRSDAWEGTRLDLAREPLASIRLKDVGSELFFVLPRVPGYTVVKTTPRVNMDINRRYPVPIDADTQVIFVVRKIGMAPKEVAPALTSI
jgi:uncharacterized GH25 family protein